MMLDRLITLKMNSPPYSIYHNLVPSTVLPELIQRLSKAKERVKTVQSEDNKTGHLPFLSSTSYREKKCSITSSCQVPSD